MSENRVVINSQTTRVIKLSFSPVPSGGGDVTKVGTPVADELGVWTGNGTIKGVSTLKLIGADLQSTTFNGVALTIQGTGSSFLSDDGVYKTVSSGEFNTASNVGVGSGVFKQKVGVDLEFKTLVAGSGVTINSSANELEIVSTGGVGDVIKVGTPVINQVGTWVGDGFLKGDSLFTWDGNTLTAGNFSFNTAGKKIAMADGVQLEAGAVTWRWATFNGRSLFVAKNDLHNIHNGAGTIAKPAYTFRLGDDTGLSQAIIGTMDISVNGIQAMNLDNVGGVKMKSTTGVFGVNSITTVESGTITKADGDIWYDKTLGTFQCRSGGATAWFGSRSRVSDGSESSPSRAFFGDGNTGSYRESSDVYAISTGGFKRFSFSNTFAYSHKQIRVDASSVSAPAIASPTGINTGLHLTSGTASLVAGGVESIVAKNTAVAGETGMLLYDFTAGTTKRVTVDGSRFLKLEV